MLAIPNEHLEAFEAALDPAQPERASVPAEILGYGEMSTVLTFSVPPYNRYAFKRMALFRSPNEIDTYETHYKHYNAALAQMGLHLPAYGVNRVPDATGQLVLYLSQERLAGHSIANKALHALPQDDALRLLRAIQQAALPIFLHNQQQTSTPQHAQTPEITANPQPTTCPQHAQTPEITANPQHAQTPEITATLQHHSTTTPHTPLTQGRTYSLDIQISNWAIQDYDPQSPRFTGNEQLIYIDTSTPMYRINGKEQLDPELFLRICPASLVWIIRWLFLEGVLNRYYNYRLVVLDLLANLIKEGREDLLAPAITETNAFFAEQAAVLACAPLTQKEIRSYYKEDALIWRLFLSFRRMERFLKTKIQRKRYNIILPGPIQR